jgi:death on curing protein
MEVFLILNGFEIDASVDEQERLMLDLAGGLLTREQVTTWLEQHVKPAAR